MESVINSVIDQSFPLWVTQVVDGGEAKRQLLATLDRLLGINDQSELSSPPATIGLPTTLLDTIDNLLEL